MKLYRNYTTEEFGDLRNLYRVGMDLYKDHIAFVQKEEDGYREITYLEFGENVDALGTELYARGFAGKRIMLIGEGCYAWACAYMATVCGVGVVVPTDKGADAETVASIAKSAEVSVVIHSPACAEALQLLDASIEKISFDEIPEMIRSGNDRIVSGYRDYLKSEIDPNAMSVLTFTTSSTGEAKGVMLSHRNICFGLSELGQMIRVDDRDRFLSVLPLHHVYECTCGLLFPLSCGASVAFTGGVRHLARSMRETRATVLLAVPLLAETLYKRLWANIEKEGNEKKIRAIIKTTNAIPTEAARTAAKRTMLAKLMRIFGGKLRMIITAGSAADPEVLKGFRELGVYAYQAYMLSECASPAAINRDRAYLDSSAGMPTPNTLLDIYDMQSDGTGEIRFKGDNLMLGYYNQPDRTALVMRDGWFYTGDLGYIDNDGFLHVTGRKSNMIVTADRKNIYPEELEGHLTHSKFVSEAVVVGYPNAKTHRHSIVAILHPDYTAIRETYGSNFAQSQLDLELRRAVSEANRRVAAHKRITNYVIRETEFPKNSSRKILRKGIAEETYAEYRAKAKNG